MTPIEKLRTSVIQNLKQIYKDDLPSVEPNEKLRVGDVVWTYVEGKEVPFIRDSVKSVINGQATLYDNGYVNAYYTTNHNGVEGFTGIYEDGRVWTRESQSDLEWMVDIVVRRHIDLWFNSILIVTEDKIHLYNLHKSKK
jgi:hypothetical protein